MRVDAVAQHQAVLGELVGDREHGGAHALVVAGQEAHDRDEQVRRVEVRGVVVLHEDAPVVDALVEDLGPHRRRRPPASARCARRRRARARRAAHGRPRPSTSPSTRRSAAGRRASPRCPGRVRGTARSPGRRSSRCPPTPRPGSARRWRWWVATASSSMPHTSCWCWSNAPFPMRTGRELRYPDRWSRVCSVRSVSPPIPYMICRSHAPGVALAGERLEQEREVLERLPLEAEVVQRAEHERGVADPRVAVVPVALAAGRLRQRRRGRGHDRPGGRVAEALQRRARCARGTAATDGRRWSPAPASRASTSRWPRSCAIASSFGGRAGRLPTTAPATRVSPCSSVVRP